MIYRRLHRLIKVTQVILLAAGIAGCGYTTRSLISGKYKTIYIAPFTNKIDITRETDTGNKYVIYKPNLETDVTKTVINKFIWDGNLKPIRKGSADLALTGEVIEFRREPLRYTESDEVEEYRINIVVNMRMENPQDNSLVWEEKSFTGNATYFTVGTAVKSESTAITEAITDLARRIVERTVEEW